MDTSAYKETHQKRSDAHQDPDHAERREEAGASHLATSQAWASRPSKAAASKTPNPNAEFLRAENEDDDGYDPYSDRRPAAEPLFERDPWA